MIEPERDVAKVDTENEKTALGIGREGYRSELGEAETYRDSRRERRAQGVRQNAFEG